MEILKKYKNFTIILSIILLIIISLIYYLIEEKNTKKKEKELSFISSTNKTTINNKEKNYIDIKGNVKNPGVYEFEENERVIDAIKKAGGLKKNANTNNINLSQKLKSEMVIYVYSNSDINKKNNNNLSCDTICNAEVIEINNCIENNKNTNDIENKQLININIADLKELQQLDGIGESKAQNIIDYRNNNGYFKTIEDIKNISGIGDALYEKIKDKITV